MFSFCHLCQPVGTSNIGSCHQLTLANIWFSSLLIFGVPAARHYQIFGFQQIFGVLIGWHHQIFGVLIGWHYQIFGVPIGWHQQIFGDLIGWHQQMCHLVGLSLLSSWSSCRLPLGRKSCWWRWRWSFMMFHDDELVFKCWWENVDFSATWLSSVIMISVLVLYNCDDCLHQKDNDYDDGGDDNDYCAIVILTVVKERECVVWPVWCKTSGVNV